MNFVATGPVTPPLASEPWHGPQKTSKRSLPTATESREGFTGFGTFAATSRCSRGTSGWAPRGTTPAGMTNTRSPGWMRTVCVMLSTNR